MQKLKALSIIFIFLLASVSFAQQKVWSLKECINYALEHNISVKQTALNVDLSEEDLTIARGNFLPTLSGSSTGNLNFGSYIGQDGSRISSNTFGNNVGLNLGLSIFNGYRNLNTYKQAQLGIKSSEIQLQKIKDDISVLVVNNYLNVLLSKENYNIAIEQLKVTEEQVQLTKDFVDAGSRPKTDLYNIEADLASNKEQVVKAQNSIDLALLNLSQALQISKNDFDVEPMIIDIDTAEMLYSNTEVIFDKAVENRPEIKTALLNIDNAEFDINLAKAALYPSLSLTGGIGTSYQHILGKRDVRNVIDPNTGQVSTVANDYGTQFVNNLGYNIGLSLNIPIFNGFKSNANVKKSKLNRDRISFGLDQAKQELRATIENAYYDAKAALNQYQASQASLKAQEESFNMAQISFSNGIMTSFEFQQVKNRLINAQSTLANAKYNFIFKSKLLEFYYGLPLQVN